MSSILGRTSRRAALPLILALALASGCGVTLGPRLDDTELGPLGRRLRLSRAEVEALEPALRDELRADPHHYFRYVARRMASLECDVGTLGPLVNLHGDAHVEQYLVTSLGRGLGDFDEATLGPVGIDLLRLATSLQIASRSRRWDANALWARFLAGYLAALDEPSVEAPEPAWAARVRASFRRDHRRLLAWADTLFLPVDAETGARLELAMETYSDQLARRDGGRDRRQFEVVRVGRHRLGVGSRATTNYLVRARGPTDAPEDDLIVEAKAVTENPEAWCLPYTGRPDPLRILVAATRLSDAPFREMGAVELNGQPYWLHEWVDDYVELEVEDASVTEPEMLEILYDVGVQLGRGHPRNVAAPYDEQLRDQLRDYLVHQAAALWLTGARLAEATWAAWRASFA